MTFSEYLKSLPPNTIFRLWELKPMFTPYEQEIKSEFQSIYKDETCKKVYIRDAIELPDGDILMAVQDCEIEQEYIEYFKLSQIDLARSERDKENNIE